MLLKIFRFFKGFVRFSATGKFPERFLNAAAVNRLNLWEVYPSSGGLRGAMAAADYKRARHIARRSGLKLRISQKRGLPFFIKKHSVRIGIPIGALAGAVLLIVLSQFIWTVDIVGNKTVSDYRIRQVLEKNGVYPGGFKGAVDVLDAQRQVQIEIDELSWVSINNLGCKSTADVREKTAKTEEQTDKSPCNIKAKCDGVITKINAQNGIGAVEIGSGVKQGDLLVSGVMPTEKDTIRFVRAKAEVFADVNSKTELKIPKEYNYYSVTENRINKMELNLLWLSMPASLNFNSFQDSVSTGNRKEIVVNGNALPLGFTTQTTRELANISARTNKEQAELSFDKTLLLTEVFENPGCEVKERKITVTEEADCYNCACEYVLNQNIAESVDFNVTEH